MGWTTSEDLVCILEEGTMVVYDLRGEQVFARVVARVSLLLSICVLCSGDIIGLIFSTLGSKGRPCARM